jgi:hypothetical protein
MLMVKRGIIMDITKIKRRERRFYRTEVNGDIVYTDTPQKNKKPVTETKPEVTQKKIKEIPVKTLKSIQENTKLTPQEKKQIIDKILLDLRNTINPDIDEIAEMIYAQLSEKDLNVTQESVKQIVQNNAHHRPSRTGNSVTTNTEKGKSESYDFLNDRKELETVIDDIVEENKKEDIREKTKKEKIEQDKKKDTEKKNEKGTTERPSKKADTKDKPKAEPEKDKPKEEFKLDFGDDESEDLSDSDDELGLKF